MEKDTYFIDEKNIKKFLELGGKFLFTDTNYKDFTKGHIINSIHFPSASLRTSRFVSSKLCSNNGIVPLQYVDDDSIQKMFMNTRIYKKDYICVYGGQDEDVYSSIFVLYTLYKYGYNKIYYLNCDWKLLHSKYITLEFPQWKPYKEDTLNVKNLSFTPDEVYYLLQNKTCKFLDVRSNSDYEGKTGVWMIKGHIPTAYNIFWKELFINVENDKKEMIPSQKFLKINELKKKFTKFFNKDDRIAVYCNTGSEGSVGIFVMKFLFGWEHIKLFEKSFGTYQYLHQICPDLYPIKKN